MQMMLNLVPFESVVDQPYRDGIRTRLNDRSGLSTHPPYFIIFSLKDQILINEIRVLNENYFCYWRRWLLWLASFINACD